MKLGLQQRLDQILPRITSQEFLSGSGIGNEIACYIFDYAPTDELEVREHISFLLGRLESHHSELRVKHLNLLDEVIRYLKQRKLFDKTIEMQETKGDAAVLKALQGPLSAEKVSDFISKEHRPGELDLLLISGVGSVWPMLRAHSLLNCMHRVMGQVPLVMFYPGTFDGTTLRLFGQSSTSTAKPGSKPYYRAFLLVPEATQS
jgi:hypothetical protein